MHRATPPRFKAIVPMSPAYAGGGGSPSTSGTTGAGARNISANSPGTSRPRWRAVRTTLDSTCWVSAPRRVRLPPHTLRMTTAGRIACSARQLVASIDGSRRKRNTAGNSLAKCLAGLDVRDRCQNGELTRRGLDVLRRCCPVWYAPPANVALTCLGDRAGPRVGRGARRDRAGSVRRVVQRCQVHKLRNVLGHLPLVQRAVAPPIQRPAPRQPAACLPAFADFLASTR